MDDKYLESATDLAIALRKFQRQLEKLDIDQQDKVATELMKEISKILSKYIK